MSHTRPFAALFLAALLLCALTACCADKHISGTLVEVRTDESGALSSFVLEQDGKRTGVMLAEGTLVWPAGNGSWNSGEALRADFQKDLQPGNKVSAWCYPRKEQLTAAEGENIPAYWGQDISITGILEQNVLTLRDGTAVDRMKTVSGGSWTYQLPDGTELLRISDSGGPEYHYVAGQESLDGQSEPVQRKIQAYYDQQGPLYDEEEELEKSYAAYLRLGENFSCDWIERDVSPCASSQRVLYFQTSMTLPLEYGGRTCYTLQLGAAFDRETGEKLSNWDLFAVPEEEVRRRLPELCGWAPDTEWPENMMDALDPDWIVFFPESVSVDFPPGTLEGEAYNYGFGVDYRDAPEGFFQPWAIPVSQEE